MKKDITLPEWHKMAEEGIRMPMRIQVHGSSMYPLLRVRRDYVTIEPISETPQQGDIVLFCDPCRENRYVLHRIWRISEESVLTWGDNCDKPDGRIPFSQIWGRAVLIERGRRHIVPAAKKGLRFAKYWHTVGRLYRPIRRQAGRIIRTVMKTANVKKG